MTQDWVAWHKQYDTEPFLARRLEAVQQRTREALHACPAGPIRLISMCAGDGRDLMGALLSHPRRNDVRARLVESDPTLEQSGRARARRENLAGIEFVLGDASNTSAYAGATPADVLLLCGVFGNVLDEDIARTIHHLPELCASGARVIWTRHRRAPDLIPTIRRWFTEAGFNEVAFDAIPDSWASVGVHHYAGQPRAFVPDVTLFQFVDTRKPSSA